MVVPVLPARGDESHLTFYAALLVESDPEQEYALFSSEYPDVVFPGLSVASARGVRGPIVRSRVVTCPALEATTRTATPPRGWPL